MEYLKMIFSGIGGGVAVAVAIIIFLRDRIETIIDKRIEYKFDKQLERDKGLIEQKKYNSQHKFDKEFEVIQELMEKSFDFTFLSWDAYCTIGNSDKNDDALNKYINSCDEFTVFYMRNCAFIPDELAETFDLFVKEINEFRRAARAYHNLLIKVLSCPSTTDAEGKMFQEYQDTMKKIHNEINKDSKYSHDELIKITRKYYEKLEIK